MLLQTSVDIPSDPGLAISLCDPPIAANKYAVTETDSQFGEIKEELTELTVNLYYQNGRAKKKRGFWEFPISICDYLLWKKNWIGGSCSEDFQVMRVTFQLDHTDFPTQAVSDDIQIELRDGEQLQELSYDNEKIDLHQSTDAVTPTIDGTMEESEIHVPKRFKTKMKKKLSWRDLSFTVGDKTKILSNCWGEVPVNEVCAIMGPSGAGKSSLLNVLAGRCSSSGKTHIEGEVYVGSRQIDPVTNRKNIAYVMQDDSLMATATPREALRFSATLRLSSKFSKEDIEELVTMILEELGITHCADTMIGGPLLKGISGGERKRTSVGVEIITDPVVSFRFPGLRLSICKIFLISLDSVPR